MPKSTAFQSLRLPSKSTFPYLLLTLISTTPELSMPKLLILVKLSHILSLNQYWLQIMFHLILCVVVFEAEDLGYNTS